MKAAHVVSPPPVASPAIDPWYYFNSTLDHLQQLGAWPMHVWVVLGAALLLVLAWLAALIWGVRLLMQRPPPPPPKPAPRRRLPPLDAERILRGEVY